MKINENLNLDYILVLNVSVACRSRPTLLLDMTTAGVSTATLSGKGRKYEEEMKSDGISFPAML